MRPGVCWFISLVSILFWSVSDQSGQNPPVIKQGTHNRNVFLGLTSELMLNLQLVQNWVWWCQLTSAQLQTWSLCETTQASKQLCHVTLATACWVSPLGRLLSWSKVLWWMVLLDTLSQRRTVTIVRASQPQGCAGDRNRVVLGECGGFISPKLQLSRRWLQLQNMNSEIKGAVWDLCEVSEARVRSRHLGLQEHVRYRRVSKWATFFT